MDYKLVKEKTYQVATSSLADWYEVYGLYKNYKSEYVKVHIGGYNTINLNFNVKEAPESFSINGEGQYFKNDVIAYNELFEMNWDSETILFKKNYGLEFSYEAYKRKETWKMPKGTFPTLSLKGNTNVVFVGICEYLTTYVGIEHDAHVFIFQKRTDIKSKKIELIDCVPSARFWKNTQWNSYNFSINFNGFKYELKKIEHDNVFKNLSFENIIIPKKAVKAGRFFKYQESEVFYEVHENFTKKQEYETFYKIKNR